MQDIAIKFEEVEQVKSVFMWFSGNVLKTFGTHGA